MLAYALIFVSRLTADVVWDGFHSTNRAMEGREEFDHQLIPVLLNWLVPLSFRCRVQVQLQILKY